MSKKTPIIIPSPEEMKVIQTLKRIAKKCAKFIIEYEMEPKELFDHIKNEYETQTAIPGEV